jgi:ABC-2 type transport system permease protein
MNTPSSANLMNGPDGAAGPAGARTQSSPNTTPNLANAMTWLVRREFWENRAIWMLPAVIGGLLILAALFGGYKVLGAADLATVQAVVQAGAVDGMLMIVILFFIVMSIYSTWYLLDCLYADRKDRSILFWKSLPISDTATVLSKLGVAMIVVPLVYFAVADVTTLLVSFIVSVRASSYVGSSLWSGSTWLGLQALWLYLIVTSAIWYLPVAGWLLVVSAWAKRAVMLWSILPPVAVILAERLFIGTHLLGRELADRLGGYGAHAFEYTPGDANWVVTDIGHHGTITTPVSVLRFVNFDGFFSSPDTWIGAVVGVALIAGAIQLRIRRTET